MITRRKFLKNSVNAASSIALFGNTNFLASCAGNKTVTNGIKVFIPIPIQVVIDDVGWWCGEDGSKKQEPYRTGINRNHVPADYQAIVELGKSLGIKPQAATILCEWDKENILRELPTSTWMGENWDNSKWIGPWMEEAAEIIRNNADHYELTIHGVGHEYWENGKYTRAEWTDSKGQMRPKDQVEKHLDYYEKLMNQHNLGSFPKSFVPAAFRHSFGPSEERDTSLAELLKKKGVNYINSPFNSMCNSDRIQYEFFGFDSGVMTIDRGNDEFEWLVFPADPEKELTGPTCGLHWPNLLHPDPEKNSETVQRWIKYLKPYDDKPEMMLAPDSVSFQHQLAHHTLTKIEFERNSILLDFSEINKLHRNTGNDEITLKIMSKKKIQLIPKAIQILSVSHQQENEILYTVKMKRNFADENAELLIA